MTDNRDAHTEQIAEQWRTFRKHSPTGAYLPVGQLDGDCRECGQAWPCESVTEALLPVVARIKADAAAEIVAAIEALADEWERSGAAQHTPWRDLRAALSAGRTALDTQLAQARTEALRDVRQAIRDERKSDPSTYNVWSRVSSAIDRAEASGEGQ